MAQEEQWARALSKAKQTKRTQQEVPLDRRINNIEQQIAHFRDLYRMALDQKNSEEAKKQYDILTVLRANLMFARLEERAAAVGILSQQDKDEEAYLYQRDCIALAMSGDILLESVL